MRNHVKLACIFVYGLHRPDASSANREWNHNRGCYRPDWRPLLQTRRSKSSTETGAIFRAVSTDTGNYTVSQLPIGSYELNATVQGFKKYSVRQNLTLAAAQVMRVDIPGDWSKPGSNVDCECRIDSSQD